MYSMSIVRSAYDLTPSYDEYTLTYACKNNIYNKDFSPQNWNP